MFDPALSGHCLICGGTTYGQSECDRCSDASEDEESSETERE